MNATQPRPTAEPALAPVIRTATEPLEISQLRDLLNEHHYLGAGRPAGHILWQRLHGFRPLLAESFHDPARHQGTLYKVTNWTSLGFTKGFRRHRTDFYQDLESPKQLWVHPLQKNARALLLMPGYDAFNDLLNAIDPASLARALNRWLIANSDLLPKTLAIDGKDLGGKGKLGAIVTLCHHATGVPLAMATYSGEKDDCELPVAQALLQEVAEVLPHADVTGDALHCQKNVVDRPQRRGGCLPRPQGQPTLYQLAKDKLDSRRADWTSAIESKH